MGNVKLKLLKNLLDNIANDGQRIINEAARTNSTKPRSRNMMDAYGAAVYYRGQRVRTRYVNNSPMTIETHSGWEKHGIPPNTGRGYLESWFNEYKPKGDLELVCVNAVYYAQILEEGAQGRPSVPISTKYSIISQTMGSMGNLAKKYNGTLRIIKA